MSIDASPPAQPPQMSPDKRWFWDGAQWRPIPQHEAAFPSWKALGEGFVPPVAAAAPGAAAISGPPPAAARRGAAPAPAYRIAGPAPDVAVPLWRRGPAPTGLKKYANIAAGAVAVVMVAILASVFIPPALSSGQPVAKPTPVPTAEPGPQTRSDAARVAYLLSVVDGPMSDLKDEAVAFKSCSLGMTSACVDAVIAIDNTLGNFLPQLDKAPVGECVAAQQSNLHNDLMRLNAGNQVAVKGYKDGRKSEFSSGAIQEYPFLAIVQTDYTHLKAASTSCSSVVTGP